MSNAEKYLKSLELSNVLREPVIRNIIDTLQLPTGGKGLDAGCGGKDNPELLEEDRLEYHRLCREDSPDFILNIPGYYGFFTYSLFWGRAL